MNDKDFYQAVLKAGYKFFRTKRVKLVYDLFGIDSRTRILDLGGSTVFWQLAADTGLPVPELTILNVKPCAVPLPPKARWIVGDASRIPFDDQSFDLVFCNSVIEHVGVENRAAVAAEIQRVAPRYFVQTPNRNFVIEPHFLSPFIHWAPLSIRPTLVHWFTPWSWILRPTIKQCEELVKSIALLNTTDMQRLFPNATIRSERFCGWSKSLMAVKGVQ